MGTLTMQQPTARKVGRPKSPPVDLAAARTQGMQAARELRCAVVEAGRKVPLERTQRHRVFDLHPERDGGTKRATIEDLCTAMAMIAHATSHTVADTGTALEIALVRIVRSQFVARSACVLETGRQETVAQGTADPAQMDGMLAFLRGDVGGMERAAEAMIAHHQELGRAIDAMLGAIGTAKASTPTLTLHRGAR